MENNLITANHTVLEQNLKIQVSSGYIHLESKTQKKIKIYNTVGKMMDEFEFINQKSTNTLSYPAGIYFVKDVSTNKTTRVVIK